MTRGTATAALAVLLFAFAWLACGVKSPPIPPEEAQPEPITDLHGASSHNGIRLTWGRPIRYASGKRLSDLQGFVLMRSEGVGPFHQLAQVPVTDQGRIRVQHVFNYVDSTTAIGSPYRYYIVARTTDDYESKPSNVISLVRTQPEPTPNPETYMLPTPTPLP
jgi:hypothetical protein